MHDSRSLLPVPGVVLLSGLLALSPGVFAEDPASAVRSSLEWVVKDEATRVFQKKNEDGVKNHRATYSKKFLPVGDERWQVSFTEDIAGRDRMRTERYSVTIARNAKGKWEVADRELMETYDKLVRNVTGDEKFYRFERFDISREGMDLSATNGTLIVDYLLDEPDGIRLYAADLSYEYDVPKDAPGHQRHLYPHLKRERPQSLELEPHVAEITCDPVTCGEILATAFNGREAIEVAALDSPLAKLYSDSTEAQVERRRERPFAGFRSPRESERRWLYLRLRDKQRENSVALAYDNFSAREVTFRASGFGSLFSYPSVESRASASVSEIERREDLNARHYELTKLKGRVQLAVDDAELVRGDIEFTVRAKRDLDEIVFGLQDLTGAYGRASSDRKPSLTVNSLQNENGEDLTWVR